MYVEYTCSWITETYMFSHQEEVVPGDGAV